MNPLIHHLTWHHVDRGATAGSLWALIANQKGHVLYDRPLPESSTETYVFRGKRRHPWAGSSAWQKLPAGADRTHTSGSVSERSTMGHCVLILSSASANSTAELHIASAARPTTATRHRRTGMLSALDIHRGKNPKHSLHICAIQSEALNLYHCTIVFCLCQ